MRTGTGLVILSSGTIGYLCSFSYQTRWVMVMQETSGSASRSRQIKSGIVLFLLLQVVIFTLQNTESINVVFLWMQFSLPRAMLLFVFFLVGFLSGLAVCNWKVLIGNKSKIEP